MDIFERIQTVICDYVVGPFPEKVTREARLVEDLDCDSLDVVELVMAVEEEFDIVVDGDKADQMKTVGDIEAYVKMAFADREMQVAEA